MKEIFFIRANQTKTGGAEVYLERLSKVLDKKNINYQIIYSRFPKFIPSWVRVLLFNIQVCSTKKNRFYFSLERITCPDVYRAGDGVHKVFLKYCHKSIFNPLHRIYLYIEKRCFNNAKLIIANSKMVKNQIIKAYGINDSKIHVIYNGIEICDFDRNKAFNRLDSLFKLDNHKIILFVGSGFERKGVREFLEIISRLKDYNIKAIVVGKEKNIKLYYDLAIKLDIGDKVVFTGPREDVSDFYAISDIFVLPTHYEPFSNVVLEAMAFENIVFTTKQNGASEILDNKFIMSSPSDYSIVDTIYNILDNEDYLDRIKSENRKKVRDFTIEKNTVNTLNAIREFL